MTTYDVYIDATIQYPEVKDFVIVRSPLRKNEQIPERHEFLIAFKTLKEANAAVDFFSNSSLVFDDSFKSRLVFDKGPVLEMLRNKDSIKAILNEPKEEEDNTQQSAYTILGSQKSTHVFPINQQAVGYAATDLHAGDVVYVNQFNKVGRLNTVTAEAIEEEKKEIKLSWKEKVVRFFTQLMLRGKN